MPSLWSKAINNANTARVATFKDAYKINDKKDKFTQIYNHDAILPPCQPESSIKSHASIYYVYVYIYIHSASLESCSSVSSISIITIRLWMEGIMSKKMSLGDCLWV